jgi:uncharacterized protein with NRDE domain
MCTVTYYPLSNKEFILTSNRDEQITRLSALAPQLKVIEGNEVLLPVDQQANGTWIFSALNGVTVCLLNGAFEKHLSKPPYKKSRGLIVLDVLKFDTIDDFTQNIELEGIEPFTMVMIENKEEIKLKEFIWDGNEKYEALLDAGVPYIWSSATLYDVKSKSARTALFNKWTESVVDDQAQILLKTFHLLGRKLKTNIPIYLNRNLIKTVSVTQILNSNKSIKMEYLDIIKEKTSLIELEKSISQK